MATPTRLTKFGIAGKAAKSNSLGILENASDTAVTVKTFKPNIVASTAAQDTGIQVLPGVGVVAYIKTTTPETTGTTKTLSIGTVGGVGTEFGSAEDVSAAGRAFTFPNDPIVSTAVNLTYSLGSADFVELDCEVILLLIEENA